MKIDYSELLVLYRDICDGLQRDGIGDGGVRVDGVIGSTGRRGCQFSVFHEKKKELPLFSFV